MKNNILLLAGFTVIVLGGIVLFQNNDGPAKQSSTSETSEKKKNQETVKSFYDLTSPSSTTVIVNKHNKLPLDYTPDLSVPNVRLRLGSAEQQMKFSKVAIADLEAMFKSASKDSVNLVFGSGYRSASLQEQFYKSYVAQDGQEAADTYSARAGYSEHQTGLVVDITSPSGICHLEICWEESAEGRWAAENAYKFGFVVRYPEGKDAITGYQYEPWHLRYVGIEVALAIHESNFTTLEEFFELEPAPDYKN